MTIATSRSRSALRGALLTFALLAPCARVGAQAPRASILPSPVGQMLPAHYPINPTSNARSGLYSQPYVDRQSGWNLGMVAEYASAAEFERNGALEYTQDDEIMRTDFIASRDLGARSFLLLRAGVNGVYDGVADRALNSYHRLIRYDMPSRDRRPINEYGYWFKLPNGTLVTRKRPELYLGDLRIGLGVRASDAVQGVLSLTLPTSTGPEGFGRHVGSVNGIVTARKMIGPRVFGEMTAGLGYTPTQGDLTDFQRTLFASASAGLRVGLTQHGSLYGSLFSHSPYYKDTGLRELNIHEISAEFGWVHQRPNGREWRLTMIEDFVQNDPGIDVGIKIGSWR
jgi:hypothetical protein